MLWAISDFLKKRRTAYNRGYRAGVAKATEAHKDGRASAQPRSRSASASPSKRRKSGNSSKR